MTKNLVIKMWTLDSSKAFTVELKKIDINEKKKSINESYRQTFFPPSFLLTPQCPFWCYNQKAVPFWLYHLWVKHGDCGTPSSGSNSVHFRWCGAQLLSLTGLPSASSQLSLAPCLCFTLQDKIKVAEINIQLVTHTHYIVNARHGLLCEYNLVSW